MEFLIKDFNALTTRELYEILKARVNVFVVEQKCAYPEIDGLDLESLHLFSQKENGAVSAYLRLFRKLDEKNTVQLGRVLTVERGTGLGAEILRVGIRAAFDRLNASELYIEAQTYAAAFYEKEGFRVTSGEFLEDGIPHVQMRRTGGGC